MTPPAPPSRVRPTPVPPNLVIISGPAGSGKTTLAVELAARLGWPRLSRDELKQGMAFGSAGFVPAVADPLTMPTYHVFFAAIDLLVRAQVSLVAEAAFGHARWRQGLRTVAGPVRLRLVRCHLPDAVARQRALDRIATDPNRAAHADVEHLAEPGTFDPFDGRATGIGVLDAGTLDVETAQGWRPGLDAITAFCRSR